MQSKSFKPNWKSNKPSELSDLSKQSNLKELGGNNLSRRKKNWLSFCLTAVLCIWALTACTGANSASDSTGKETAVESSVGLSGQQTKEAAPVKSVKEETTGENNASRFCDFTRICSVAERSPASWANCDEGVILPAPSIFAT